MSGKKLTRKDFELIEQRFHDEWHHMSLTSAEQMVRYLIAHVREVGVFAPEEPTDEDINATIARAQGWGTDGYNKDGKKVHWKSISRNEYVVVDEYQPVSNLGQALEAAAALDVYVDVSVPTREKGFRVAAHKREDTTHSTAADAARAISLYLYRQIKDGEA